MDICKRWNLEMPKIVEGSILIMAKAGSGVAMFSMGMYIMITFLKSYIYRYYECS